MSKKKESSLWAACPGSDSIWSCFWSIKEGNTYAAVLLTLCSSWKAHGILHKPQRDLPACHLQRLFFLLRVSYQHQSAVLSSSKFHKISKTSCLWCVNQALRGKQTNFVPTPTYSHFRTETKCILSSSWQPVEEIPLNVSFWMVNSDTTAWRKETG